MNKSVWLVLLGVVGGLVGAGVIFMIARPPAGEMIQLLPPPSQPPLVVHITGAVSVPGVYNLPPGSRMADAIEAAGGMTEQANPESLNLAQVLEDGLRIHVPLTSEPDLERPPETSTRGILPLTALININTADQAELETLPEIGPHLAGEIITYRETNGPFKTVDELLNVSGVGPIILETIRDLITVGDQP
jgi:competence protein ComEA